MYELKVFISGRTRKSSSSLDQLRATLADLVGKDFSLMVINTLENPDEAEKNDIIATPTLLKTFPGAVKKIIGDFHCNREVLARFLEE